MNKFWNWVRDEDGRTLYLNGTIAEESWFEDEITPAAFKAELMAGEGISRYGSILRAGTVLRLRRSTVC